MYSENELQAMLRGALDKLGDGTFLSGASAGGGTSYSRQQRVELGELVTLYRSALIYKQTGKLEMPKAMGKADVRVNLFPGSI